jgi:hypothetical protein
MYGSGVVATRAPSTPVSTGNAAGSGRDLSRPAALMRSGNPCTGYFPTDAKSDLATVSLNLSVDATGRVAEIAVQSEDPAGQGFADAARACLRAAAFTPARDAAGNNVAASLAFNLHFSRS